MKPDPQSRSSHRFGRLALAVASVAGILLCALIAWPFLGATTWADHSVGRLLVNAR